MYPRISIITPSFNQGKFIEKTILSVLSQDYPNVEYIIIDGASVDNTLEVIKKYSKNIHYWVSEPDLGQSHAINKGLRLCTGDIWAYLNSDDCYLPGTFRRVVEKFREDASTQWVTGYANYVSDDGEIIETMIPDPFTSLEDTLIRWNKPRSVAIQASNFMRREVLECYGYFDESLHYSMDFEFGLRLLFDNIRPIIINDVLAEALLHRSSKTVSKGSQGEFMHEDLKIVHRYLHRLSVTEKARVQASINDLRYWTELGIFEGRLSENGCVRGVALVTKLLAENPRYFLRRPTWGVLKQRWLRL